jgi:hypothetical protein
MGRAVSIRFTELLHSFIRDEAGALPITTGYLMVTLAASIPLGFAFYSIYEGLCGAGSSASFILGLF